MLLELQTCIIEAPLKLYWTSLGLKFHFYRISVIKRDVDVSLGQLLCASFEYILPLAALKSFGVFGIKYLMASLQGAIHVYVHIFIGESFLFIICTG